MLRIALFWFLAFAGIPTVQPLSITKEAGIAASICSGVVGGGALGAYYFYKNRPQSSQINNNHYIDELEKKRMKKRYGAKHYSSVVAPERQLDYLPMRFLINML